jgi:hypothetical protein
VSLGISGGFNTYAYVYGNPNGLVDADGLQAIPAPPVQPRLPSNIGRHNRFNDSSSQFNSEFRNDAFPDPSGPVYGLVNKKPWCRVVCQPLNSCPASTPTGISLGGGCYSVCSEGPFADVLDRSSKGPPVPPPAPREASPADWNRLFDIYKRAGGR